MPSSYYHMLGHKINLLTCTWLYNHTSYLDKASLSNSDTPPCATDEMSCQQHTCHILSWRAPTSVVSFHCCLLYECLRMQLWSWLLLCTANSWFRIIKYAEHNTYYREAWGILMFILWSHHISISYITIWRWMTTSVDTWSSAKPEVDWSSCWEHAK
jgi:hypothetical protein